MSLLLLFTSRRSTHVARARGRAGHVRRGHMTVKRPKTGTPRR